ncbi:hypothetical protein FA95DRAFT_1613693 [Auriscalpium vulgare]|uniref:Uncharacterized protein n=1 Tax=Auriscalpium vulgare TaxID=40419 RepID=A0ACB8R1N5_9AGAM|nr:hypothetical protein FA95DRAFT_1613693 [Auriscalpium vulgare]
MTASTKGRPSKAQQPVAFRILSADEYAALPPGKKGSYTKALNKHHQEQDAGAPHKRTKRTKTNTGSREQTADSRKRAASATEIHVAATKKSKSAPGSHGEGAADGRDGTASISEQGEHDNNGAPEEDSDEEGVARRMLAAKGKQKQMVVLESDSEEEEAVAPDAPEEASDVGGDASGEDYDGERVPKKMTRNQRIQYERALPDWKDKGAEQAHDDTTYSIDAVEDFADDDDDRALIAEARRRSLLPTATIEPVSRRTVDDSSSERGLNSWNIPHHVVPAPAPVVPAPAPVVPAPAPVVPAHHVVPAPAPAAAAPAPAIPALPPVVPNPALATLPAVIPTPAPIVAATQPTGQWPPDTDVNAPEQGHMLMRAQTPRVRKVLKHALKIDLPRKLFFENTYPQPLERPAFFRAVILSAAEAEEDAVIAARLRVDKEYTAAISRIPEARVSNLRGKMKDAADAAVRQAYRIDQYPPERHVHIIKWLVAEEDRLYIFPGDAAMSTYNSDLPFCHDGVIAVIRAVFFSPKAAARFDDALYSVGHDGPQIPDAMAASSSAAVEAALRGYLLGREPAKVDFSGAQFVRAYLDHMSTLRGLKEQSEPAYNALMRGLYVRVTGNMTGNQDPNAAIMAPLMGTANPHVNPDAVLQALL